MEINLNADPEFRKMVAQEVRAAIVALTRSEIDVAIKEACRRTAGATLEKVPSIIQALVKEQVRTIVSTSDIHVTVRKEVCAQIEDTTKLSLQASIKDQTDIAKIQKMIEEKLSKVRLEIIL